jgi:adenine phosphoribosyltransferase
MFKDITPVLSDIKALRLSIDEMTKPYVNQDIDVVVGIESRGFIFGAPMADKLNAAFVPIRKPDKLPWKTQKVQYQLEYGTDSLEIHTDAINEGDNVLIVDDLLATGGTAEAACELVAKIKGTIKGLAVLVELEFLKGREKLNPYNVHSIVKY